jgi:hypothetical protein
MLRFEDIGCVVVLVLILLLMFDGKVPEVIWLFGIMKEQWEGRKVWRLYTGLSQ